MANRRAARPARRAAARDQDPARGWVSEGVCSQRNPSSRLSILGDEDFETIRRFFLT